MSQDILAVHAAGQPGKVAVWCAERSITFAELNRRGNQVAHRLLELGVEPGDRVATMIANSIEGHEISAGLRKISGVGVPVNFRLKPAEVAYILEDSGARVVIAGPEHVATVEAARKELASPPLAYGIGPAAGLPGGWRPYAGLFEGAPEADIVVGEAAATPSMIYTSGTTGRPKGAIRKHGLALEISLQNIALFGLSSEDVHLVAGPGYHSAVAYFSSIHLLLGATVVLMPKYDAEQALALIECRRVTTTFMAPTLVQRIVDLPEVVRDAYDVSSLRAVIMGAAPCPFSLKERATEYLGEVLWEFYGATETGINLVLRPDEQLARPGSCGRPTPHSEVRLLDPTTGEPVADGVPGQLWVRNVGLAEYHNRPDATAGAMRDGFFSVGDVAYQDGDGYFYICDRLVDMIISGAVNIYPAEIEATLFAHPAVADVAVIGVPDPSWGESVKAVVQLRPGAACDEQALIEWCRPRLADYKRPRSIDFVAELPRGIDGKLHKRALRERYWAESGRNI